MSAAVCLGLDLREGEGNGRWVAVGGEGVDPGATRVSQSEELGHLVEGLAGCIVHRVAHIAIGPDVSVTMDEVEVSVPTRDDEGQSREGKGFNL